MLLKLFIFTKKDYAAAYNAAHLKENKTFFVKKNCGFVDSEFVKICHEQVIYQQIGSK